MDEDKIVLICATGRSGSTTVQRLLNTIPNANICGENGGAINSLLDFYKKIKLATANNVPGGITPFSYNYIVKKNIKPSWYNSYNFGKIKQMVRIMIMDIFKLNPTTNIWGFKEIRYDNNNINYIYLFKELFPQTKIIIQIRENIKAQSGSGWFQKDKSALAFLYKTNQELYNFYQANREYCFFTTFEKMFDRANLKHMFAFIGCQKHYNEEKITEILNNNIKD
jgi:hypothetical protein